MKGSRLVRLERAQRDGVKMPDGRVWEWHGYTTVVNKHNVPVRVEIWAAPCRYCGAEFTIKQKLLVGRPAYNFLLKNCWRHRGMRARASPIALPDDFSDLV